VHVTTPVPATALPGNTYFLGPGVVPENGVTHHLSGTRGVAPTEAGC